MPLVSRNSYQKDIGGDKSLLDSCPKPVSCVPRPVCQTSLQPCTKQCGPPCKPACELSITALISRFMIVWVWTILTILIIYSISYYTDDCFGKWIDQVNDINSNLGFFYLMVIFTSSLLLSANIFLLVYIGCTFYITNYILITSVIYLLFTLFTSYALCGDVPEKDIKDSSASAQVILGIVMGLLTGLLTRLLFCYYRYIEW